MRAIVQIGTGGPEVLQLQEVPEPEVQPGHLLVRVKAICCHCPATVGG
jgi:NADPH:quinone reductase-like Zn-dependent oxidoreductase